MVFTKSTFFKVLFFVFSTPFQFFRKIDDKGILFYSIISMSIATSQQLQDYFDHFRETEVTFTKDVLRTLALDPRQVYIKCNGSQWPCIINSTSLMLARIIIGNRGGAYAEITKKEIPPVSIRFCFINSDNQPVSFFVSGRVSNEIGRASCRERV